MNLTQPLSDAEQELVRQCLNAVVNGPFFPDWEFHSLFGVTRDEAQLIATAWPNGNDEEQGRLVVNALNNLLRYPHGQMAAWRRYISSSEEEVAAVLRKFRS